jgi:hypothetical protein
MGAALVKDRAGLGARQPLYTCFRPFSRQDLLRHIRRLREKGDACVAQQFLSTGRSRSQDEHGEGL